jgi:hypothetical protein
MDWFRETVAWSGLGKLPKKVGTIGDTLMGQISVPLTSLQGRMGAFELVVPLYGHAKNRGLQKWAAPAAAGLMMLVRCC